MKCPDCGLDMKPCRVVGFDDSFRCDTCGGVLTSGWVVNVLASGGSKLSLAQAYKTSINKGDLRCPFDRQLLIATSSDESPLDVESKKCSTCGFWWFPTDSIFGFVRAWDGKREYSKVWNKGRGLLGSFVMPVVMTGVLAIAVGVGVYMTQYSQRTEVPAASKIQALNVERKEGVVVVRFRSDFSVSEALYRKLGDTDWSKTIIVLDPYGYRLEIIGDSTYEINILGEVLIVE